MKRLWKVFFRVLRSYSVEEKVISIVVAGILVFVMAQTVVDVFKVPSAFGQSSSFTEGMISENLATINPLYLQNEAGRDISSLVFSGLSNENTKLNEGLSFMFSNGMSWI